MAESFVAQLERLAAAACSERGQLDLIRAAINVASSTRVARRPWWRPDNPPLDAVSAWAFSAVPARPAVGVHRALPLAALVIAPLLLLAASWAPRLPRWTGWGNEAIWASFLIASWQALALAAASAIHRVCASRYHRDVGAMTFGLACDRLRSVLARADRATITDANRARLHADLEAAGRA